MSVWASFILDKAVSSTRTGAGQVKDIIRTYVWAVLGAQVQTQTAILETVPAFGALKQFLGKVEDSITPAVDLPNSIARSQDFLQYGANKVDDVFGFELYMALSDVDLRVGKFSGYNSFIIIAAEKQTWASIQKQMLTQGETSLNKSISSST